MRLFRQTIALLWLALVGAITTANASSVFDGTNADLWLVDEDSGQVTGYDFNTWLDQFAPGGTPLYPLGADEQALINLLQNSSLPMTLNQPAISIVGIDPGMDGGNPEGHTDLLVLPVDGSYDATVAVRMMVNTQLLSLDPVDLFWTVDGGAQQSLSLTKDALNAPGAVEQGGYLVHTIHIARDGAHTVDVDLYEPPRFPGGPPQLAGSETRNYTLAIADLDGDARDEDGDGIPDVIEAEIGLDPDDEDWQKDTDGDGWSDFDEWLRATCLDASLQPLPGTDCTDADGNPEDTDGDGWADFDERVRGTNHLDAPFSPSFLIEEDETVTSASLQARVRSYKDFPQARRLYEVERLAAGTLPDAPIEPLLPDTVVAVTVLGDTTYYSKALLTDADLARVGLNNNAVPPRMQAAVAENEIANARVPSVRLPAGNSSVLNATYRSTAVGMIYRRIYKRWLPRYTDLSPQDFRAKTGPTEYADAESWRTDFVAYLVANAVVQDSALVVDLAGTTSVSMFEAALSRESRLIGLQDSQLLSSDFGVLDPDVVQLARYGLSRIAGSEYSFDNVIAAYDGASQPGQALQPVAQWIEAMFLAGLDGTRSDAFIASRFKGDPTNDYLVRLLQLPGAFAAVSADATLADRLADSDADNAGNGAELNVPLARVTLPWVADSDGDSFLDGNDECPIDPFNTCGSNPILPVVTVGFDVVVAEPEAGSNVAIVSIILDRIVDFDVTIDYTAFVATGDTAEGGTDFIEISGTVTIPAGERVALIAVPVLADADSESPETFTIQITGVTGATIGDDGLVVVTINNTDPGANTAPVFSSAVTHNSVEGSQATGYTATADDLDNDTLIFSTSGGTDEAAFTIDSVSGELSFVQAPAFDSPTDADANNDYEVQLTVGDGRGGTDVLDLVVSVVEAGLFTDITYPTPNANLGGGVTVTTVTGRIRDPLGNPINPADIISVDVDGNIATLDAGDPGRWSVQVPVTNGDNVLSVTLEHVGGSTAFDLNLQNFAVHSGMSDIALDAANNRLLVVDGFIDGLLSVDLATGDRTVVSVFGIGSGVNFNSPRSVALDEANNRALVVDWQRDALMAVNLANGDRSDISRAASVGTGFPLDGPQAVALDAANNRALVTATQDDAIIGIDLATGNRTVLSGQGVGAGPEFGSPQGIELDAPNNRVLVSDSNLRAVVAVDLASGDRTVISDATAGSGIDLSAPIKGDFDASGNRLLVADQTRGLIAVDLSTGNRTLINAPTDDYGPNASRVHSVAFDAAGNVSFVSDGTVDAIFNIDMGTGSRSIVSDSATGTVGEAAVLFGIQGTVYDHVADRLVAADSYKKAFWGIDFSSAHRSRLSDDTTGTGPAIDFPGRMDFDAVGNRVFYVNRNGNGLFTLDLASGDRSQLSGNAGPGIGANYGAPSDVSIDVANGWAAVLDSSVGLIRVDLASGDRSIISDGATGTGPFWNFADGLDIDLAAGIGYVVDDAGTAVYSVDMVTGDRIIISDNAGTGSGPNISFPNDIGIDPANNRALIINRGTFKNLMAVDLTTGDRTILSDNSIGSGVQFQAPYYIELDLPNDRVFVYDVAVTGVIVVQLSTGERAVAAK